MAEIAESGLKPLTVAEYALEKRSDWMRQSPICIIS
jgi:hypothetical protein